MFEDDNIDSCFLEDELDAMYKTSLAGLAVLLVSFLLISSALSPPLVYKTPSNLRELVVWSFLL